MRNPKLSFVIPARDEEQSVEKLVVEILSSLKNVSKSFEIIFVDDGSTDKTYLKLKKLRRHDKRIKVIRLRGSFGKSVALQVGFDHAKKDIIFTMDADLQDNPKEIPNFLKKLGEGYDLVSGWKKNRHDPHLKKVIPSRIINFLTRLLTGVPIHDTNCGFKVYRRVVIESLNLYGELYRFIPVIAYRQNFRVGEIEILHRKRLYGQTKFGWERGIKGILDLLTITFLTGFIRRPGHFFGSIGIGSFFIGFLIGFYIAYLRFTTGSIQARHPLLFLGMLLMIIGVQLISTGLLAEMIVYSKGKLDYTSAIKESLGIRGRQN
ncbi:glycosyl transferase family 2 [Candidatus Daviesbacteria bacterium RIFCSPHIGHO2_12_FULL_37_11]|uniref:Glycosyl transferase family 2 n=1 Tax=Candidatus Daviesbacteria bacterium RIFCSPHIGHO2_12_FULL_37_11 TaxID=1797777 RepID=A0A1F5KEV6_9BACT|nr:MAG: glycosyl transferase family 2 [Candidatus Daviesbacteria bacterium RIFCSPHIGHO2_01_FULL_37_27]OGE39389.1 MAG: glycosyl transferase family 2 [Candidatus Daviesbacteria bacterium RIFCSPHIGHO2_12_FULL_37_11]OGE45038.1 MAG: glycosyl transferase family 2 [Candidatus Daviesbacteria bacterium RIFCSPLOWO2_01_FULL_37_10]